MVVLIMLLALFATSACSSSGGYRKGPESPAAASPMGGEMLALEEEEVAYSAGDSDGDAVMDVADEAPAAEPIVAAQTTAAGPARREGGGFLPPPPAPPADARFAQNVPRKGGETGSGGAKEKPPNTGQLGPTDTARDVPQPPPGSEVTPGAAAKIAGPLLIYNATIYMAVFEATKAIDATQQLTQELGGYLVRRDDRTITVRVPAKKFRPALEAIAKLGDVLHREESVQDVTDEFFDLQVRLKNAHAMRDRLAELLKQAKNVEEALMVERELGRVTEQIERLEGRLKLLRELISFSTITVEFKPRPTDQIDSNVRLPFYWLNQLGLSQLLSL